MALAQKKRQIVTFRPFNEVYGKNELGLTNRQWRVYVAFFSGHSQKQIAEMFGITREAVGMIISRARKANPNLPTRKRANSRHATQISQLKGRNGQSLLDALGVAA